MKFKLILGLAIVALIVAACNSTEPSPTTEPVVASPVEETTTEAGILSVDLDAVLVHSNAASRYLDQAYQASSNYDIAESATFTLMAADEWYAISDLWEPVPEMAYQTEQVAIHMENAGNMMSEAADAFNSGDISTATVLIKEATREIDKANTDMQTTTRMIESYT